MVDYYLDVSLISPKIRTREIFTLCNNISSLFDQILDDNQCEIIYYNLFTLRREPSISIRKYIQRIIKHTDLEDSTLILSLIYIDRVCKNTGIEINRYNLHRLLLTSILIAIKFNEDNFFSNAYYAKIVGITLAELNWLEKEFLEMINFSLIVKPKEFKEYEDSVGKSQVCYVNDYY